MCQSENSQLSQASLNTIMVSWKYASRLLSKQAYCYVTHLHMTLRGWWILILGYQITNNIPRQVLQVF